MKRKNELIEVMVGSQAVTPVVLHYVIFNDMVSGNQRRIPYRFKCQVAFWYLRCNSLEANSPPRLISRLLME